MGFVNYADYKVRVGDRVITNMGVKGKVVKVDRDYIYYIKPDNENSIYTVVRNSLRKVGKDND